MNASSSFSIDALSSSGQLVGSAPLREDVPVSAGWQGDVVLNAPGMLPRHVLFAASGGKVRAAIVDARAPAFVGNLSLSTSWMDLVAPCDVRFAGCVVRVRASAGASDETSQASRPATTSETSNKGAIIITALAFLVLLPAVVFVGVQAAKAREHTSTLAETHVPPSAPPTTSIATSPAASPRKFQPRAATAAGSPVRPQANDAAAERRVAEALFAGDNVRALQEAETMRTNNPGVPEYRVVVRVLRAKVRRGH